MSSRPHSHGLPIGHDLQSLMNPATEFYVPNPYAAAASTMWDSTDALQDVKGLPIEPRRDVSPSTTGADPAPGVDTIHAMTKDMRILVKKIQDLRHLGIEDSRIALPKICVVGDQSTGKSSLIEGMSEIKVPRSAGTCTRCPMEINLSESDEPWKCDVKLTYSHTYSTKGGIRKITKASKLGPWYETAEPQDVPFLTLHSKDEVQDAIKRAQLAILSPHRDPAEFLPSSSLNINDVVTPVKFSPNVVRLDISAPGFPNLAFYDLPGVINQAEVDEEAYLVTLVEDLVKHYVAQENCIILLTLPMTDDATNSSAARIVREIKATGRTLGVLTKPDRVEDIAQWADLLNGHKFHLGHGYYVVRNNPNPSVEHRQARIEEAQFFSTHPWTSPSLAPFKPRLGTYNLQNALSTLLIDQIKTSLPNVEQRIREKLGRIREELRELPEPVNQNSFWELCKKLQELNNAISACLEGGSQDMPTLKMWNKIAQDFASAIQRTRPKLRLVTDEEDVKVDDESDCEIMETKELNPSPKRKFSSQEGASTPARASGSDFTKHFREFSTPARNFCLEEIRGVNEDCSSGPTAHLHPKAIERVHKESVSHWVLPMKKFLDATYKQIRKEVMTQVKTVLQLHQETRLFEKVSEITSKFLLDLRKTVDAQAAQLYKLETTQFVANDRDALQKWGAAYYNDLKKARKELKVVAYYRSMGRQLPEDRAKYDKVIEAADFGSDPFTNELKLMAAAYAHYKLASCRFVDYICMIVRSELFAECKNRLFEKIEEGLGMHEADASNRCLQLMADDPERLQRREFLLKETEKLELALEWLGSAVKSNDPGDEDLDIDMSNAGDTHIKSPDDY